jgi:hypothetical protein
MPRQQKYRHKLYHMLLGGILHKSVLLEELSGGTSTVPFLYQTALAEVLSNAAPF